ncbi:Uncharacterized protein BP5553_02264 [Venustampulla echinocandica]|uniref:FAM192A/Fyv6 N-terminal domain-containing protein n=1 Tax=Venustampulla echinocandica TaxID=2656787 RepID=A0A370U3E8_9HELO|nr:Uncharacterized protein BP5553_02264 [Venustampulla echinocandica]RDL42285.1 Uncharacterized protein BP5553_02264 [Venustampulla echinocandica]
MSSGFVSGGTADAPIERSDEWLAAQQEIEANHRRKAEQARQADGKSLFETLEANKAAKQDAFDEAHRLKNQFRALDEDEAEFLDSVLESTRAEEARVKKETAEGLALFRQQQEEADKKARRGSDDAANADDTSPTVEEEVWVVGGRKRKRTKEKEVFKGVRIRRASTANEDKKRTVPSVKPSSIDPPSTKIDAATPSKAVKIPAPAQTQQAKATTSIANSAPATQPGAQKKASVSLVNYGSDEDDDW